jgi:amino acid transporter
VAELKKVLKLRTVVSASAGLAMATSVYLAGLQIALTVVGELAWISILVAGALCMLSAMCFSELVSLYPTAAGIKLYIQHAFNEKAAIAIGMFYVITGASIVGAEAYLLSSVMIETVGTHVSLLADRFFWMSIFILMVAYINYRGVSITGWAQDLMTYVMFAFLLFVSIYTLSTHPVDFGPALHSPDFTLGKVLTAAGLGVFLFVGFEWVTPLAEETEDYRMVGKGMMLAVALLAVTYSLFVLAMYVGLTDEQRHSGTTIPHILFGRNLFGPAGGVIFIFMSLLASLTSFNSGVLNFSRFGYAMARANILPRVFAKLHPDYATPWVAILGMTIFSLGLCAFTLLSGQFMFIITMAAALECFIYVVIALCVMRLRKKFPDQERSYRVPFGKLIPIINIIVFSGLMIGIFADTTRDAMGKVLFHNYWTAVAMAVAALLMTAYALAIVPRLQQAAAQRTSQRKRRRPGAA